MKYDKFFDLAKKVGITECELYISEEYSLSAELFHGEISKYDLANSKNVLARGKYNGKMGTASCDIWSNAKAQYLVDQIVANAKVIETGDPAIIFKGSEKYRKISGFNKELSSISIDKKIEVLKKLEQLIINEDKRITKDVELGFQESRSVVSLFNSHGLKLVNKTNSFVYFAVAVAKSDSQVKRGFKLFLDNNFSKFNVNDFAKKVAKEVLSKLDGYPCDSKTYKAILSPNALSSLIGAYIGSADAEDVQKKSSMFIDKLNTLVASKKVTIEDKPLQRSIYAEWFDGEGVATYNKPIIKKGVLCTYLYNLITAKKDGVQTTGNAVRTSGKIYTSPIFLAMKPGKQSFDELAKKVENGVYITDISGIHAGLNPQSGNFSLQSDGFMIENGKVTRSLDMITISGNLMDLFKSITDVGNDVEVFASHVSCPSVIVKKLAVSGK